VTEPSIRVLNELEKLSQLVVPRAGRRTDHKELIV
jgi:hypothetical protein